MIRALSLIGQALRLWWREFPLMVFFNLTWLALQVPIVTGPPATAALYVIARRLAEGELIEVRHGWQALRQVFGPAWIWAGINLLMVSVLAGNFWMYQGSTGWAWTGARLVWGFVALAWFAGNLFYWPFWLAQEKRSALLTYRNCFLFLARQPGFALTLVFACALLTVFSVLTTLPFAAVLISWLALVGVLAVEEALHPRENDGNIVIKSIQ
jgi:hypothetical protein